jgi:hypothetical protein
MADLLPIRKIKTRVERLEEERKKQEELMQMQKEVAIEKARLLKRYLLAHAAQQEGGRTEANISLGKYKNEINLIPEQKEIIKKEELKKDAENILTILDKIKIKPGKKKIIKHYMLNKLGDTYNQR